MGVIITIASGRYLKSLDILEKKLGITVVKLAINGALIEVDGRIIHDERISKDAYEKTMGYIRGKVPSIIVFAPRSYAIEADDDWFTLQWRVLSERGERMDVRDYAKVTERLGERPSKILIKDNDKNRVRKNREALRALLGDEATIISSGEKNIEILPKGTDKSRGLMILTDKLSIPISETIAFGDWDNDAGMLQSAGIGVAMANGSEKAKAAADFITLSNNEDGIAYALDKFLFSKE